MAYKKTTIGANAGNNIVFIYLFFAQTVYRTHTQTHSSIRHAALLMFRHIKFPF